MSRSLLSLIALVAVVALAEPPATPSPRQSVERAACLKACAGAPRDAQGPALLRCLSQCEGADDAGVR
jgi:hypothetical protein